MFPSNAAEQHGAGLDSRFPNATAVGIPLLDALILDDVLTARATHLTGMEEKTTIVHAGLEALTAREAAKRLAALGGGLRKWRSSMPPSGLNISANASHSSRSFSMKHRFRFVRSYRESSRAAT